jgi:hypothetical protein
MPGSYPVGSVTCQARKFSGVVGATHEPNLTAVDRRLRDVTPDEAVPPMTRIRSRGIIAYAQPFGCCSVANSGTCERSADRQCRGQDRAAPDRSVS